MMKALVLLLLSLGLNWGMVQAEGLDGKVMCGYQGWFRVPADGSNNGWHHYSSRPVFEPGACSIDLWPDVRELPAAERFPTAFQHPDGTRAEVFSSVRPAVIKLHFEWMRTCGIDGIFLQRFAVSTKDERFRRPMDAVLQGCRQAAQETGRQWCLMYDLSGVKPGETTLVVEDWKRLNQSSSLADARVNPAYLRHRGKPLVSLWGLGFHDRLPMLDEWRQLIDFFKNDARFGGCTVMTGVPAYWRTLDRDAIQDAALHSLLAQVDVLSPWTVGRYGTPEQAAGHAANIWAADLAWCRERKVDYLPVAFPGFSWHNLSASRGQTAPLNAIPRLGGRFFWSQCLGAKRAGARSLYVAMFDELDEATAIFKCRNDPPAGKSPFVSEPELPSDHYLWLTGEAGRLFRGERGAESDELPRRGG